MILQLDSENADRDIHAEVLCLTHTPDAAAARLCQALVYLGDGVKGLDGTGGNFTLRVNLAGRSGPARTVALAAGQTKGWMQSEPFAVPAATAVTVYVLSPNAADIDVDVTAYLFDAGAAQGSEMLLTSAYDAAMTAAQAGDAMTLANGSITADTFDGTTAFPLASEDAGDTEIARTGADADTLETLSDQIDTANGQLIAVGLAVQQSKIISNETIVTGTRLGTPA